MDAQQSMLRFAAALYDGLRRVGERVELFTPGVWFGRGTRSGGLGKWVRYVDKFLIFPATLARRLASGRHIVHICDHSNSLYAKTVRRRRQPLLITCHDLGAVRGALGEATDCPASPAGRLLQRWITKGLGMANIVACDSTATREDVQRLVRTPAGQLPELRTILLGQNAEYQRLDPTIADERLTTVRGLQQGAPFILNVGSSLPRKNRDGVLRIVARIKDRWNGQVVFAGQALPQASLDLARELGIDDRVVQVVNPSDAVLEALYNRAYTLLFPSKFEGFGWPVIEAQACGCPVICSDAASLPEVAGLGAVIRKADDESGFASDLLSLRDPDTRAALIQRGLQNVARFTTDRMIDDYLEVYRELAGAR